MRKILGNVLGSLTIIVGTALILLIVTAVLPFALLADLILSYPDLSIKEWIEYIWEKLYVKVCKKVIEVLKEL